MEDIAGRLDSGLFDFAFLVEPPNLSKYNCLDVPAAGVPNVAGTIPRLASRWAIGGFGGNTSLTPPGGVPNDNPGTLGFRHCGGRCLGLFAPNRHKALMEDIFARINPHIDRGRKTGLYD